MAVSKEIKCPGCHLWVNRTGTHCPHCHSLLDRNEAIKIERENKNGKVIIEKKQGWVDRFLERTAQSENPFVLFFSNVIRVVWMIYMAVLGFIIWFIAWMAG